MGTGIVIALFAALFSLLYAIRKARAIIDLPVENEDLVRIGSYIEEGAHAFLSREYYVLAFFIPIVAIFLAILQGGSIRLQGAAFIVGALCSGLAGWFGMGVATKANSRTAWAAKTGIGEALAVAFSGGSVMGMTVVGLALLGIGSVLGVLLLILGQSAMVLSESVFPILTGFSFGASTVALFARVGGGIYTKAADVGADLVGKVEIGIPEDDHRNPAVIADNVGDNVGDVAGMGADLFESYAGSLIGCKPPMSARTLLARWKSVFLKMTIVIQRSSQIMSAIMSAMSQEWGLTCLNLTLAL